MNGCSNPVRELGTVAGITATAASALEPLVRPAQPRSNLHCDADAYGRLCSTGQHRRHVRYPSRSGGFTYEILKYGGGIEPGEVVV